MQLPFSAPEALAPLAWSFGARTLRVLISGPWRDKTFHGLTGACQELGLELETMQRAW